MPETPETYITFGTDHNNQQGVGPLSEGYVTIEAEREVARGIAFLLFPGGWSFDYDEIPDPKWVPYGELLRFGMKPTQLHSRFQYLSPADKEERK